MSTTLPTLARVLACRFLMRNFKVPATSMVFKEILSGLQQSKILQLSAFSSLPNDVLNYNNSFLQLHSNDCISTYIHENTFREHRIDVDLGRYVNFLFTYTGSNMLALKDRLAYTRYVDVVMVINAKAYALSQSVGENKKAVSFMATPEVLIESYGLRIEALPPHVAAGLRGTDPRSLVLELALPPRVRVALEGVYETRMQGALFRRYMFSKAEELVCETVHLLNAQAVPGATATRVSADERLRQKIEAAAYLYRQSVGRHPAVSDICKRVGVNKNVLNDGFKDMFGQSPAEYARAQTLEWARSQLLDVRHSVKSISEVAGYANVSAFTRAYRAHFGTTPTRSNKAEPRAEAVLDAELDGATAPLDRPATEQE